MRREIANASRVRIPGIMAIFAGLRGTPIAEQLALATDQDAHLVTFDVVETIAPARVVRKKAIAR